MKGSVVAAVSCDILVIFSSRGIFGTTSEIDLRTVIPLLKSYQTSSSAWRETLKMVNFLLIMMKRIKARWMCASVNLGMNEPCLMTW